jgi:single-strand DNA-binding protein
MSAQLAAYGRLGTNPVERTSQAGKAWATCSMAITMRGDADAPPLWVGVVAFGRAAETLCRHAKGDLLSVSGQMKVNRWRDNAGNDREQLQVIADVVISAKSVRPGGGRRSGEARA